MARHDGDIPPRPRPRPRSNTSSFPNFSWRRRVNEPSPAPASVTAPHQEAKTLAEIISSLTPPGVLSLATARQLVEALKVANILGNTQGLTGVLSLLCCSEIPGLRIVGYEALSAFLGNPSTPPLSDHERFVLSSLFPSPSPQAWNFDVWEKAQQALQTLTKDGTEVVGIEVPLLRLLRAWVEGAVFGLLSPDNISSSDRNQREKSVSSICEFLTRTMTEARTMARLSDEECTSILEYLGGVVDRSLLIPTEVFGSPPLPAETQAPVTPTRLIHRRHHSSTSITQVTPSGSTTSHTLRRPSDTTVSVYLHHLSSQMRYMSPSHLMIILPVLFRALAFYSSPLPRLSLTKNSDFETEHELERRIVELLHPLLNGAYSSTCFVIMKRHTLPDTILDARVSVQTSLGACRALRLYWRRALCARLARALLARATSDNYTPSGAPGGMDIAIDTSLMERAWQKDEVTRGELVRVGRLFKRAAEAWVGLTAENGFREGRIEERDEVLCEIAGVVKDVVQEYDERGELDDVDEEEKGVVGGILGSLTDFVHSKSDMDGAPYILPLTHYADASTPFLRSLSILLSRSHDTTPTTPPLTSILLSISDHLSDSSTSRTIETMLKRGDLSPISMDWITHWAVILNKPELSSSSRPMTRIAILNAMQDVFQSVRDVPVHRMPFVDVILASCQAHEVEGDRDGYEVVWHVLADEMIMRMSEAWEVLGEEEADKAEGSETVGPPSADADADTVATVDTSAEPEADAGSLADPEVDAEASAELVDGDGDEGATEIGEPEAQTEEEPVDADALDADVSAEPEADAEATVEPDVDAEAVAEPEDDAAEADAADADANLVEQVEDVAPAEPEHSLAEVGATDGEGAEVAEGDEPAAELAEEATERDETLDDAEAAPVEDDEVETDGPVEAATDGADDATEVAEEAAEGDEEVPEVEGEAEGGGEVEGGDKADGGDDAEEGGGEAAEETKVDEEGEDGGEDVVEEGEHTEEAVADTEERQDEDAPGTEVTVEEGDDEAVKGVDEAAEGVEGEVEGGEVAAEDIEDAQEEDKTVEPEVESLDAGGEGVDVVEDVPDSVEEGADSVEGEGVADEGDTAVAEADEAAEEGQSALEESDAVVDEGDVTVESEGVTEGEVVDVADNAAEEGAVADADTVTAPEVEELLSESANEAVPDDATAEVEIEAEVEVAEGSTHVALDEEATAAPSHDAQAAKPSDDTAEPASPGVRATANALQFVDSVLSLLSGIAINAEDDEPEPPLAASPSSPPTSNTFSRSHSDFSPPIREKEPGLMSLLSSFASGVNSRSQSQQTPRSDDTMSIAETVPAPETAVPAAVGAVVTLIHIFSQLAFTPYATSEQSRAVAIRIFKTFVDMLREAKSSRVRLTVLQFFFRLRVDRDHRLFTVYERYDRLGHIASIASITGRTEPAPGTTVPESTAPPPEEDVSVAVATRARALQRDGRRASRGRDRPDRSASSRSRSRVASRLMSPTDAAGPSTDAGLRKPLWRVPEALPFTIPESDTPSDGLMSYDPETSDNSLVLPTSSMLNAFIDILCSEKDWEIMAYVLCHLPTLLANKHLFCGPKSRQAMTVLLETLCNGILSGELGKPIAHWPLGLRSRDAQGLAFHTLSVLISYRDCFSAQQRHILVEVLMSGLSAQQSTVKACIQALSIAAFELQTSVRRFLPDILTKLSQIMTNASIATYIIDFLAIVGSQPSLYANFIERDFKMVFGVALQYLRLHNRPDSPESTSVLSQHVRLMSFSIVYTWFLAVKLKDRPQHVKYITRQLLLANEGRDDVDEPTEVCFDWLARYTYSSGDPRPASSMLSEIIMKPNFDVPQSDVVAEKAWVVGNALVSIRALTKLGWLEVSARRPSGLTRFLARVENIPMVGPGEVDPDTISVPAILAMDRESGGEEDTLYQEVMNTIFPPPVEDAADEEQPPRPNPITGYVWQGTAPSQRRKEVAIDPSFFALQLSSYPGSRQNTRIQNLSSLPSFLRTFDRMPVIDTHKVGILYVAPGQTTETEILGNVHGSPAYTRFLEGLGRLINLRGQKDVYAGGLDPDEDGEYAYAFWDDIGQVLYHTATLMPNHDHDPQFNTKKRHIGNDFVRIVWNDSGAPYRFDTLSTQFQFCNIIIESHSLGAIAAFSDSLHANEYFRVTVQRAAGMRDFAPLGDFKLISAQNLPLLVRQLSLLADWYSSVYQFVSREPGMEMETNWRSRLRALKRFRKKQQDVQKPAESEPEHVDGILAQEAVRDFTSLY